MNQARRKSSPVPARERNRQMRRRRRDAVRLASTEVPADVIEGLIRNGWLSPEEAEDPAALGAVLADLADCYCDGRLKWPEPGSVTP